MRITTNAILRNYKSNLGASLSNLDMARTKVDTEKVQFHRGRSVQRTARRRPSA